MYQNDLEAYTIANVYGFMPPVGIGPKFKRRNYTGKFEPDRYQSAETRTMLFAGFFDASNFLVKYNPSELIIF